MSLKLYDFYIYITLSGKDVIVVAQYYYQKIILKGKKFIKSDLIYLLPITRYNITL